MTNGTDRLDRIEKILEDSAIQHAESLAKVDARLDYMAARQQYHDEAFERFDAEMKALKETQEALAEAQGKDGEHIRALVRIAEMHHLRLEGLEGGEPA